jgi:peroxiredoxin
MKRLFFLITALLPTLAFAQIATKNFTINGKAGTITKPTWAYLFYQTGANKVIDSALVINGNFTISGNIFLPSNSTLVIDHTGAGSGKLGNTPDFLNFWLDKGTTNITTDKDSIKNAAITGSVINDDSKLLTQLLAPVNNEAKKLNDEKNAAPQSQQNTPQFQHDMQARYKALQDKQHNVFKTFITAHPASFISLIIINMMGKQGADPVEMDVLYTGLDASLKDMEIGRVLKSSIDQSKATAIGSIAPDFTQPDVNGMPVKLSSFRGKYVLLDFWASWCGPCRAENPNVVKAYTKYKDKNFTVLGVSLDRPDGKADWQKAIKSDGLSWTQVSDLKYWSNEAAVLYFVQSIPANFLLDPNGKIIAKDLRGVDLDNKLAELFGK